MYKQDQAKETATLPFTHATSCNAMHFSMQTIPVLQSTKVFFDFVHGQAHRTPSLR